MNVVVTVRGKLRRLPEQELRRAHDSLLGKLESVGRSLGNVGHRAYFRSGDSRELMVIDTWTNVAGAEKLMANPNLPAELGTFFEGVPEVSIWTDAGWAGYAPEPSA